MIAGIARNDGGSRKNPAAMILASAVALAGITVTAVPVLAAPEGGITIVEGRISSTFGTRADPKNRERVQPHNGVDVAGVYGAPIHAPADGVVLEATEKYMDSFDRGKVVSIRTADGVITYFAHLASYDVKAGDRVKAGQKIAEMGSTGRSTGPHVHIETHVDGEPVDPATIWAGLSR